MKNNETENQYLLLFRDDGWYTHLSVEELEAVMGRSVNDGPFAETKEAIGGYLLLTADSLEEATAIAKGMPGLDYGTRVEVRPIATECPLTAHLQTMASKLVAA